MSPSTGQDGGRDEAVEALRDAFGEFLAAQRRLRGRDAQHREELSFPQYRMLAVLADEGPLPASRLAAAAHCTPATVTQMLDHLAESGIVERSRSEEDRRVVVTTLTDEGRRRHDRKKAELDAKWLGAIGELDDAELLQAARALRCLRGFLDDL